MQHDKDHFAQKAGGYDSERVQNVQNIANYSQGSPFLKRNG